MEFPTFEMERMQSTWEHKVRYDLSESGVEPLTLEEAARDMAALGKERLGYSAGPGRDVTRGLVAALHPGAKTENVVIMTGTSEANFIALTTLVTTGDEVVVVMPNYMQVHGIARGLGAKVREVWLREENGWRINVEALEGQVTARTKVICVCQPNNPTGQALSEADVREVARIAASTGAWILSDEVYRGAERVGGESASFWGYGERIVVTGGLSKAYGLPGLRIGWIVGPPEHVAAAWAMKDYTTIAPATISELLAEVALARRPKLLERTRFLLEQRWPVLEAWAGAHAQQLHWTAPVAGAICFFGYTYPIDSVPFADRLREQWSTLIVPGAHFKAERHLRIGFGIPSAQLANGLAAIDRLIASL